MTPSPTAVARGSEATALTATLRALELDCGQRPQQQLLTYIDVLSQWNAVHNLTAIRDRDDILTHHLADCLATVGPIARRLQLGARTGQRSRVLDVGSGGGLPGLIIATMLPGVDVTCIDSVGKKAAFIRQAALSMKLDNVDAVHGRVETWQSSPFDLIVSRAFATIDRFVGVSRHLRHPDGTWMAMKAKTPSDELAVLNEHGTELFHVEQLTVPDLGAERCLVWIEPR